MAADQHDEDMFGEYKDLGGDTVELPPAYHDDWGGRPGLERLPGKDLVLPPPIDDPVFEEERKVKRPTGPPTSQTIPQTSRKRERVAGRLVLSEPAEELLPLAPLPPPPAPKRLVSEPRKSADHKRQARLKKRHEASMTTNKNPPAPVAQQPAPPPPPPPSFTPAMVERDPNLVETVHPASPEMKTARREPEYAPESEEDYNAKQPGEECARSYVNVSLVGSFGRFKSKVADVVFCENHAALIYTGAPGDDELLFEPPGDVVFELKVEEQNGWRSYRVQHFGLTTQLASLDAVVVVLPYAAPETASPEEPLNNDE